MSTALSPSYVPDRRPVGRLEITVVIPALNEACQIADCVRALRWAADVVVVDGGSTDQTVRLAREAGARVLELHGQTIGAQRNVGIETARHDWVLALDADERVSAELLAELDEVLREPRHRAYRIRFRNYYLGRELTRGQWARDWHVRLFTRDHRFGGSRVHEGVCVTGTVGTLNGRIEHTPYRDLHHHVMKIVKYARWGADDLYARGRRAGMWELVARPAWRFAREYVVYGAWRDGASGFMIAALSAMTAFLKYAYLYTRSESPSGT